MDVLVIGSGAREHALAWRLARDDAVRRVRIAPGNAGTAALGENVTDLNHLDPIAVARYAARERIDVVVIGPEAALAAGVVDGLEQARIAVFGPDRAAARLESSKAYAKGQLRRAGVATAAGEDFDDADGARRYVRARWSEGRPVVVKADWLAAGKGVVVAENPEQAIGAIDRLLDAAPAGSRLVIEERLTGREVSLFALVSGEIVVPLGAACDYKRLLDSDAGPNTGGMGGYAPVPWFEQDAVEAATAAIVEPVAWRMARDGVPYRGVLYAGLMVTDSGPVVLELNARFGDPEAQVLLPLLDGELIGALVGVATGDRAEIEGAIGRRRGAAVGVVIASEGYPDQPATGRPIRGVDPAGTDDEGPILCFHAATQRDAYGRFATSGGRVVTVVGLGADLAAAREAAYRGVAGVELAGGQHRTDVALRELS
jgi:phosphoribosylamine--glycine ligase